MNLQDWAKNEKETSKRLDDSDLKDSDHNPLNNSKIESKRNSDKGDNQISRNKNTRELDSGNNHLLDDPKIFKTITSNRYSTPGKESGTESFIPFSHRTLMTHAPTIYEELIQKYESDIRNHIRIEQQMKLHSDSVINKLEDKEKQYDRTILDFKNQEEKLKQEVDKFRLEMKMYSEENQALKKALEKKIERILNLERSLKENSSNYAKLESEYRMIKKRLDEAALTPKRSDNKIPTKSITKPKFKSNSANPNSGRKNASESVQLFYSRNIKGPNNVGREEFIIPATSTRSPDKFASNQSLQLAKSIMIKRDGKSPYIHADLEKLKQYVMPKSKSNKRSKSQTLKNNQKGRKAVRSAFRAEHLHTDETADDSSTAKIKDYNSVQNSVMLRGSK